MLVFIITTVGGHTPEYFVNELGGLPYVDSVHALFGEIDLIVKASPADVEQLKELVYAIRAVDGTTGTRTHIAVPGDQWER